VGLVRLKSHRALGDDNNERTNLPAPRPTCRDLCGRNGSFSPMIPPGIESKEIVTHHSRYRGYEDWKGWSTLFCYSKDQSDYFRGETRDLSIKNADVLEIGFGSGDFLQWAIDEGARVAATEINSISIEAAQERGIEVLPANLESTSTIFYGRFDTIISFDVFEHLQADEIVRQLKSIQMLLKPNGHLLLRFPNAQSPFGLAPQFGDSTHCSFLSKSVIEQMLHGTTFKIVRYGHPYRARGRGPARMMVRFVRNMLKDAISATLNAIYNTEMSYDPVLTIVMRKN